MVQQVISTNLYLLMIQSSSQKIVYHKSFGKALTMLAQQFLIHRLARGNARYDE